jgi:hypothetical protein
MAVGKASRRTASKYLRQVTQQQQEKDSQHCSCSDRKHRSAHRQNGVKGPVKVGRHRQGNSDVERQRCVLVCAARGECWPIMNTQTRRLGYPLTGHEHV